MKSRNIKGFSFWLFIGWISSHVIFIFHYSNVCITTPLPPFCRPDPKQPPTPALGQRPASVNMLPESSCTSKIARHGQWRASVNMSLVSSCASKIAGHDRCKKQEPPSSSCHSPLSFPRPSVWKPRQQPRGKIKGSFLQPPCWSAPTVITLAAKGVCGARWGQSVWERIKGKYEHFKIGRTCKNCTQFLSFSLC